MRKGAFTTAGDLCLLSVIGLVFVFYYSGH